MNTKRIWMFCALCLIALSLATINWITQISNAAPITYARDVAPILQKRCEECHHAGGIAPMQFTTYDAVRPWAKSIKEKVASRQMPPFHATGALGRYLDDPRLTDVEIATITQWVDGGAQRGNLKEAPKPREWKNDWQLGMPDLTLKVRKTYTLPQSAKDRYVFFVFDHVFPEDTWVSSIATRPGNPKAVHHANTHLVPPNVKVPDEGWMADDFEPGKNGTIMISGWVPGSNDVLLPAGTAVKIPKGMRFGIQIHYGPNDKELSDATSLGIYLADGTVNKNLRMMFGDRKDLQIPAGEANYSLTSKSTFATDGLIRFFHVHMHLRGKSYAFRFTYPDGRQETLFDVPNYDFNWQRSYILQEPIRVAKGTQVEFIGAYDNSTKNKFNPDPTKTIRWGEFTTDEMMQGRIFWEAVDEKLNLTVKKGVVVKNESASNGRQ
ncbi:MAG: hypothetical protein HOP19_11130 [Acidobacteria bacterium]|nr:hypothetical protein [Acidobacteriota bacterium]